MISFLPADWGWKFLIFITGVLISPHLFAQETLIVVKLSEKVPLEQLADSVITPTSPRYLKFYTPQEIGQISGPEEKTYKNLLGLLKKQGFKIIKESPTRLWIVMSMKAQSLDQHRDDTFTLSSIYDPTLLALKSIPEIESVSGLELNPTVSHPKFKVGPKVINAPIGLPQTVLKESYGFRKIYESGITGLNQNIAVASYGAVNLQNIKYFYSASGLVPGPTIDLKFVNGTPPYLENWAMESEIDSEMAGLIAPGANIHIYASAYNNNAGDISLFNAILDDDESKIITYSWGFCETLSNDQHKVDLEKVHARAVAQGVNILVASGDFGSDPCRNNTVAADFPSTSPYVVSVGGTNLHTDASGATYERGWKGSGGGISVRYNLPFWQAQLGAPYKMRSIPDVAFNSDPLTGQAVWTTELGITGWTIGGGTSIAAPQWAGLLALAAEARQKMGKGNLGFLNPHIYSFTPSEHSVGFLDITQGQNGAYTAKQGWDPVTGWGRPKADGLIQLLLSR